MSLGKQHFTPIRNRGLSSLSLGRAESSSCHITLPQNLIFRRRCSAFTESIRTRRATSSNSSSHAPTSLGTGLLPRRTPILPPERELFSQTWQASLAHDWTFSQANPVFPPASTLLFLQTIPWIYQSLSLTMRRFSSQNFGSPRVFRPALLFMELETSQSLSENQRRRHGI